MSLGGGNNLCFCGLLFKNISEKIKIISEKIKIIERDTSQFTCRNNSKNNVCVLYIEPIQNLIKVLFNIIIRSSCLRAASLLARIGFKAPVQNNQNNDLCITIYSSCITWQ